MPEIKVNGVSMYCEVTGNGHPLVFIHGVGLESGSWHYQTAYFSKRYQVIAYDIRGHGRSELKEESYSIDDCVEDLRQLFDHLGVQQACLAGQSMGGNIALSFALDYPDRVNALILTGSNASLVLESVVNSSKAALAKLERSQETDIAMRYKRSIEANFTRPDLSGRISEITKPVLIIVGDRDKTTPPYLSEAMHIRIANSQMVVIPNCGHKCQEERADTFNSIISGFLQRVEAA